jgi:hypothetical protein
MFFRSVAIGSGKINAGRLVLLRVFVVVLLAGNGIGAGQPAVQVDVPAALGAKRF